MKRIITRQENFEEKEVNLHEALFSNANGYIGVRGNVEEGVPNGWNTMRGTYINGVYEIIPMKQAESLCNLIEKKQTMLNVADTQTICLIADGDVFDLTTGKIIVNERVLDMEQGVTKRHVIWVSPDGKEIELSVTRMTSFLIPSLFTIEYNVKALNFDGLLEIKSYHIADVKNYSNPDDPRLADDSGALLNVDVVKWREDMSVAVSSTKVSGISVASAVSHRLRLPGKAEISYGKEEGRTLYHVKAEVKQGEELSLIKYSTFSDSVREDDPEEFARETLKEAMRGNLADIYEKQKEYVTEFFDNSEMEIDGDEELGQAVNFNMYQLFQSATRDKHCSIAAKGLSGEGYEGHYFWDTEMYVAPFFILTNPELAKNILQYRYGILDKARENAALLGHKKGALYPWRTITGEECSGYFPSGTAAYHINGAIAYTIVQYYLTTGDIDFMFDQGEEMLLETARLWFDVGNYDRAGRFVINEVTGPDEYTCMTDNNYYTNCCAAYNMSMAVSFAEKHSSSKRLKELLDRLGVTNKELKEIKAAAEKMYFPYDEELGINPQDDSFLQKPVWDLKNTPREEFPLLLHYHPLHLYRYQVCKQADTVLAYFLFEDGQSKEVMKKSFEYYEKITTHDSSLSTCVFSIVASRLGMHKKAVEYFGDSIKLDLLNTHNNSGDGVHTANMGGSYMAIVNGFAGLRITGEGISVDPFLPSGWKKYSFKIRYKKSLLKFTVSKSGAVCEVLEGEKIVVKGVNEMRYGK